MNAEKNSGLRPNYRYRCQNSISFRAKKYVTLTYIEQIKQMIL